MRRIDYLVTTLVILLICAVLVPIARHVRMRSAESRCKSTMLKIAQAIKAYQDQWSGWHHPNPDYFIKLSGYRLSTEPGYFGEPPGWYQPSAPKPSRSQVYASQVRDFVCPLDTSPRENSHGYPMSYRVYSGFTGWSVLPQKFPVVFEIGKRHSQDGALVGLCVYEHLAATPEAPGWRRDLTVSVAGDDIAALEKIFAEMEK